MADNFANMGQRMKQMEHGFQNMERNMAETFKDLPKSNHEMGANGEDGQSQSFSSSMSQTLGDDGKIHRKE